MEPTDLTIEILEDIRAEIRETRLDLSQRLDATNGRLDQTNGRLDQTNERLDTMREELSRRIVESEIRTSTAITELAGSVHDMTVVLRASHDLRPRVERCEHDIADLGRRLP
jgi:chromosome segregation ATPase